MEQARALGGWFHFRIVAVLTTLLAVDLGLAYYASQSLMEHGPSVQLLFGFEVRARSG